LLRPLFGFSLAALLLALYAAFAIRRIPQLRRSAAIVPLALFLTAAILAGCASSGGTPKGTSTLTVTATSGTLSQNTTATLTVD